MTTSLTLRNVKGSPLTYTEVDDNFTALRTTADGAEASVAALTITAAAKAEAAALGVLPTDADMGTFTGTTIPDASDAKEAIQSLETAVETKANASALGVASSAADMGTFTGSTIPDAQTGKQAIQALETAVELRTTIAALADNAGVDSGDSLIGSDDGSSGTLWTTMKGFISYLMSSAGSAIVGFIQAGTGAVPRTIQDKNRDIVSVKDFGAVGDGVTDDTAAVQAFFNYISSNKAQFAQAGGKFAISSGVTLGPSSGLIATLYINGDMELVALNAIETMLTLRNCGGTSGALVWDGKVTCIGMGGTSYASRTCVRGVFASGVARAKFGGFRFRYFSQGGLEISSSVSSNNEADFGFVQAYNCGSGNASGSLTANWSSPVNSGSSGSTSQRTVINVDVLPPTNVMSNVAVLIGGKAYYVYNIDTINSKITVYPWVDSTLTSGSLTYIFGGGVVMIGGDSGIMKFEGIDALNCGQCVRISSLYGPVIKAIVAQSCGAGIAVGETPSAAMVTASIDGYYCEGNTIDLFRVSRGSNGVNIHSTYGFDYSKIQETDAARLSTNDIFYGSSGSLLNYSILDRGNYFSYEKESNNYNASTLSFDVNKPCVNIMYKRNSATINLVAFDVHKNRAFGYNSGSLTYIGTGAGYGPTGSFTFVPPSGTTVNGGSSAVFSTFTKPVTFNVFYDIAAANFIVSML